MRKLHFLTPEHRENVALPLLQIKQKFQITIPVNVRDELRLEEGMLLEATTKDGSIVLTPKVAVDRAVKFEE